MSAADDLSGRHTPEPYDAARIADLMLFARAARGDFERETQAAAIDRWTRPPVSHDWPDAPLPEPWPWLLPEDPVPAPYTLAERLIIAAGYGFAAGTIGFMLLLLAIGAVHFHAYADRFAAWARGLTL